MPGAEGGLQIRAFISLKKELLKQFLMLNQ